MRTNTKTVSNSRTPENDFRNPESKTGSLEIEKRIHGIHGTLETGLHMMPHSLPADSEFMRNLLFRIRKSVGLNNESSGIK